MVLPVGGRKPGIPDRTGFELNALFSGFDAFRERTNHRVEYRSVAEFYDSGDSGNYTPAMLRAIADLPAWGGEVILPNRAEAYRTTIDVPSHITVRGGGSASEMVQDGQTSGRLFRVHGSFGTLVSLDVDANAGDIILTLPSGWGSAFVRGDLIQLISEAEVYDGGLVKNRDIRRVVDINGDALVLDAPLLHDFLVSDSAAFSTVDPVIGVGFRDFRAVTTDPEMYLGYFIDARVGLDLTVENVAIENMSGSLRIHDQLGAMVSNYRVDELPNGWRYNQGNPSYGYGIILSGATNGAIITSYIARHTRNAATTLSTSVSGRSGEYGGPHDCIFQGCISYQYGNPSMDIYGRSHYATHAIGERIIYENCSALGGGTYGFSITAPRCRIVNGYTRGVGQRGVHVTGEEVYVEGGVFELSGAEGVSLSGDRCRLVGARVDKSGSWGVSIGADDVTVESNVITDSGFRINIAAVYCSSGDNPVIRGNIMPASASQTRAVHNAPATAKIVNNIALGYTYDSNAFGGAHANATFRNNVTRTGGVRMWTTNRTVDSYENILRGNASSGAITFTLPESDPHYGRIITIKKIDSSGNAVVVAANGSETIDGASTISLTSQYASIQIVSNGFGWSVMAQYGTVV